MPVLLRGAEISFAQWTRILLVVILCLGTFFRFAHLDQKVYWVDEVSTSLRISGFTLEEMKTSIVDGPEFGVDQLQQYQYPNPEKGIVDTINSLATEDLQHPPLFFLLLRGWVTLFGHSLTSLRSLAAVFSLLMLPAAWGLCRELFSSSAVGWVAIALLAVSPMQIVYAQEARHYSLWMLIILISSLALLRALRLGHWRSWAVYGFSIVLGLYTHLFFALIALGHGLYTIFVERCQWSRDVRAYLLSSGLAVLSFTPWLMLLINRDGHVAGVSWMDKPTSFLGMMTRIVGVLSRTFVDVGVSPTDSLFTMVVVAPLILVTLGISVVAAIGLIRQTPFKVWFFIVTLAGVTGFVVVLSYVILGKQIATTRYMLPIGLSLHLAVAYILTESFRCPHRFWGSAMLWRSMGATLLSAGVLSCLIRLNTPVWWNQLPELNRDTPAISQVLNQHPNSLVIVDASTGELNLLMLQSLQHLIHQNVQFKVVFDSDRRSLIQPLQRTTFLYFPFVVSPESLQQTLAAKYEIKQDVKLKPLFNSLWQVEPSRS
jgi:uncharacterized membrane protein